MYLSKLSLKKERKVHDFYELHQLIWKAFGDGTGKNERDWLFRIESFRPHCTAILVQSLTEPQWHTGGLDRSEYEVKPFQPVFKKGDRFFFFLRANAVIAKSRGKGTKSVKSPLYAKEYLDYPVFDQETGEIVEVQQGWLKRQTERSGFELNEASRQGPWKTGSWKNRKNNFKELNGQDLQGYLTVTDPKLFLRTFQNGLGRGKAFGFGLLSLKKIPN